MEIVANDIKIYTTDLQLIQNYRVFILRDLHHLRGESSLGIMYDPHDSLNTLGIPLFQLVTIIPCFFMTELCIKVEESMLMYAMMLYADIINPLSEW